MFFVSKNQASSCPWRGLPKYTITLVCFGAEAKPCDATTKSPPEGKSPARDDSRTTGERITLYAFFKVLKESLEIQNQRFEEHDLKLNQRFDKLNHKN